MNTNVVVAAPLPRRGDVPAEPPVHGSLLVTNR